MEILIDDVYVEILHQLGVREHLALKCINKYHNLRTKSLILTEYFDFRLNHLGEKLNLTSVCKLGYINLAKKFYDGIYDKKKVDIVRHFVASSVCGSIDVAKWLYSLSKKDDLLDKWICCMFETVCGNGHIEVAKWLHQLNINIKISIGQAFLHSCKNGYIELAKWMHELQPNSNNYDLRDTEYNCAFILACKAGHIEIVKWLYYLNATVRQSSLQLAFRGSCVYGHVEISKWLHQFDIDIHADNEDAFIQSCINGRIEVAKWLHQLGANIHAIDHSGFVQICKNGHLAIIKWLYKLGANIYTDNDCAFTWACRNGHIGLAKWLDKYCVDMSVDINSLFKMICCDKSNKAPGCAEVVKWLHKLGANFHINKDYLFKHGRSDIVEWLKTI